MRFPAARLYTIELLSGKTQNSNSSQSILRKKKYKKKIRSSRQVAFSNDDAIMFVCACWNRDGVKTNCIIQ